MTSDGLRQMLRRDLASARVQTDKLFQMLDPAALYERPIVERHRIIFYLGHLEAFDWNMICRTSFEMPSFQPQFDRLFEFGIDPVDGKLPQDQPADWPRVPEILLYRQRSRDCVDGVLESADFQNPQQRYVKNGQIFRVAIEHRLMHAETLAYMFHWLPYGTKQRDAASANAAAGKPTLGCIDIPAGDVKMGRDGGEADFGWDNEFQTQSMFVSEFSIDASNVTNHDFVKFVRADGYNERSLWTADDWNWIQNAGVRHPKFWIPRGDNWFYRTMFEEIPLPHAWPAYVSQAEASAYARWKGKALPTEAQYHRAAFGLPGGGEVNSSLAGNYDCAAWDPVPAGSFKPSPFGVYDMMGNGWEWTSTPFAPFEGFEPFPFYRGYSADFFDGKHFVLKGASPRTAAMLVRKSFRNWFQPHYPNIYAAFRCVEN